MLGTVLALHLVFKMECFAMVQTTIYNFRYEIPESLRSVTRQASSNLDLAILVQICTNTDAGNGRSSIGVDTIRWFT
jgi:hypothetical protein